jgi:hypothetical protein
MCTPYRMVLHFIFEAAQAFLACAEERNQARRQSAPKAVRLPRKSSRVTPSSRTCDDAPRAEFQLICATGLTPAFAMKPRPALRRRTSTWTSIPK